MASVLSHKEALSAVTGGAQLRARHLADLGAARGAGDGGEDVLAGGVAALDEVEAELVALLGGEAAIALDGGGDVVAAIEELAEHRERLVAAAVGQLQAGQRV